MRRCPSFLIALTVGIAIVVAVAAVFAQQPPASPSSTSDLGPRPPSPSGFGEPRRSSPAQSARGGGTSDLKKPLLGDETDGSRARPVHAIPLRDGEGEVIRPTDRPLLPFSPPQTCGADCHDVRKVTTGWHFNITAAGPGKVRRGEPWILVDLETATQLPLSYHAWPGTYNPEQVGITPLAFASLFGGRTPGGISGARERNPELQARWTVTGELEPNCLACHDASPAYDHAEYGRQVQLQNFRWAPSAASGLALVTGSAKEMPNTFDYLLPSVEDALQPRMPSVAYSADRFLPNAKVAFDIVREVPARRCYFCHSNADVARTGQGRWNADQDIHLARGMTCIDCHRNGLDHAMTRGYDGEPGVDRAAASALTCRGCHLAEEANRNFARGRFGASYPTHAGIPPIHFTKLSCTACHSGPAPESTTRVLKTSLAHRLGGLNVNKAPHALPHLYYPVFAEQPNGETVPNRLVWPAFWARLSGGAVTPIAPDRVKQVMAKAKVSLAASRAGDWPVVDDAVVARILALLGSDAVYVAGGQLHRLDASGHVVATEHASAQPYLWPVAHDVRPAALALGARGCTDCHAADAPIFFGKVAVDSPLASDRAASWAMNRFQKSLNTAYVADFARTFQYRPWLKASIGVAAGLLALFLLAYVVPALRRLSAAAGAGRWKSLLVNVLGLGTGVACFASAYQSLLSGRPLTGYTLMIHVAAAPTFAACAVLVTLFWAERNGFNTADWRRVVRPFGGGEPGTASSHAMVLRKTFFWIAVAASLPSIASAMLALFPVLASVRQGTLFLVHRYSVVVLSIAAALFVIFAFLAWVFGGRAREAAPPQGVGSGL